MSREQETARAEISRTQRPFPSFAVRVASDPRAEVHRVGAGGLAKLLVGTSAICGLRVDDRSVSRRHVSLVVDSHGLRVTDHDSTNGTYVSGVRVREAYVAVGQHVAIGSTVLAVEAGGDD